MKNRIKLPFLKLFLFCFGIFTFSFNANSQLKEWFKIYADEEGTARFDHLSLNIFYNGWNQSITGIETKAFSIGYEFGIFKEIPISKTGKIAYAYGLTYSLNVVHHNGSFSYVSNSNTDNYTQLTKETSIYSKNKLNTSYIEIPIEIRFRKIAKPKIRFYPGFKAGVLLNMHSTRITSDTKHKIYRQKNRMKYRYGPTLKLGIGKFNIYGFYSLTPLFEKGKGDEIYPFSIGIAFFGL